MDDRRRVKVSKYLSKHLRHEPERLGLTLGPGGWVPIDELLAACARNHFPITREQLEEVVAVDQVAGIAARGEVEEGLESLGPDAHALQHLADVARLEAGRWHGPQRLDDPLDGHLHPGSSARFLSFYNAVPCRPGIRARPGCGKVRTAAGRRQPGSFHNVSGAAARGCDS
jgi:hypothetical protein